MGTCTGAFRGLQSPGSAPALSVLYNSDILGLSLAWINPAAPFFHFKLDGFEEVP